MIKIEVPSIAFFPFLCIYICILRNRLEITRNIQFDRNMTDILVRKIYFPGREMSHTHFRKSFSFIGKLYICVTVIYPNTIYPDNTPICILYYSIRHVPYVTEIQYRFGAIRSTRDNSHFFHKKKTMTQSHYIRF